MPVINNDIAPEDVFAAGSDLKNTFCFVKQNQFICSEYIGDLEDSRVYSHYVKSIEHLCQLFQAEPKTAVCDLHPGYVSNQYVFSKFDRNNIIEVQHHWAHIASVMAEHNISEPVIGLVADGTGFGTDGTIWGGECLIASLSEFRRYGHFANFPLAGADKSAKQAIRPLLGLLKKSYGANFELERFNWLLERIDSDAEPDCKFKIEDAKFILEQLEKRINTVNTSSLGRVFDAVAAAVGLGGYNFFDAQLPMALEAVIKPDVNEHYDFDITADPDEPLQINLNLMIKQLIDDVQERIAVGIISAKFHNCLAEAMLEMAKRARKAQGIDIVALSGGVFCNLYLLDRLVKILKKNSFRVLFNQRFPSNDGGLSLGQAAIAVNLLNRRK